MEAKYIDSSNDTCCRLCGAPTTPAFRLRVLQKYDVQYCKCIGCNSLQTETPFWLEEAYTLSLSELDTGVAQRTLSNLAASYIVARLFALTNAIDFGGSDGLLCRLLRDYSINCFVSDKFAQPVYAQGFSDPTFAQPDLLTAFEVFEHFANPAVEIGELFRSRPKVLLVSTALYDNQQSDWWYLAAESGQHIFFFSEDAMRLIAHKHGYEMVNSGAYLLFVRPDEVSHFKLHLVARLLRGRAFRYLRSAIFLRQTPGVWKDYLFIKNRSIG